MMQVRKGSDRGVADFGWLDSRHTFSFGEYYDPNHMGFRSLRVINEDRVAPAQGFGTHPHRDMEILSYVLEGELGHKDSMGNGSVIRPGDVQRMTAGTGVRHSEMNPSPDTAVHFLQIWIVPERTNIEPGYEQKAFALDDSKGAFKLVASRDGRDGSVTVHQDMALFAGRFEPGQSASVSIAKGRGAWVHVARGAVNVNGTTLRAGDAAALEDESTVKVSADEASEVLLFDLA